MNISTGGDTVDNFIILLYAVHDLNSLGIYGLLALNI